MVDYSDSEACTIALLYLSIINRCSFQIDFKFDASICEQPHTVTSGLPGASDSGALFNSGIMPATANSLFQYTFNRAGDITYHCEMHPWRVAIVSVSNAIERGNNFEMSSGVGGLDGTLPILTDIIDIAIRHYL